MKWAQVLVLTMSGVYLLVAAYEHGRPVDKKPRNFWHALIASAISFAVNWYAGAFSTIFGAP